MTELDSLQKYWTSYGNNAGTIANAREPDAKKLDHLYEKDDEQLEKGKRGDKYWNDPYAIATAMLIAQGKFEGGDRRETGQAPPWGQGDFRRESEGARERDRVAGAIGKKGFGKKRRKGKKKAAVNKMLFKGKKAMDLEKISPSLERLIAFGAGWALSGDIVNRDVPQDLVREWERAVNNQASDNERRRLERKIKSRLRKSDDTIFNALHEHYLSKDHAPVPPRVGLMWDAVKHRWTRPERIGRTVWELSGHKRIRGTGTGVHERSVKAHGSGGRGAGSATAGRRFRSSGDSGRLNVHDGGKGVGTNGAQSHPAFRGLKAFKRGSTQPKRNKAKKRR